MDKKKLFFGSLLFTSGLALIRKLFDGQVPVKPAVNSTNYEAIVSYVELEMRRLSIPGVSMAIVEGDEISQFRGFGSAHPSGEAPTPQTPFFIGSVTKSFTALAVMQLVEAGKIELDAPVQRYLPWFRVADLTASSAMTVRHLLNHTSGLPMSVGELALTDFDGRPDSLERQIRALASQKLSYPPGSEFDYNNTNYNILGLIIEATSGEAYADYVQKYIFDPLVMNHSYSLREIAKQDGLAMGYRYWFGYPIPAPNLSIPLSSLPSGQLISCAEDMAHYLIAQLNGGRYGEVQILSSSSIEEMHRPAVEIREMGMYIGHYTMGWISKVSGRSTIVTHSGIVPDFGAFAGLVPEQKKGIILLYNANHAVIKPAFDEFGMGATELLAGETPSKTIFSMAPWVMRGMALIPIIQAVGVLFTLLQRARWQRNPASRPSRSRLWRRHILLPLFPNLLLSLTLVPMVGKMRGWIRLFLPDFSWIAYINGSFAAIWAFLRTHLVLQAWRKSVTRNDNLEGTNS
jgi:CubicO group peptidase (beta-lactamase class C family)